MSRDLNSAKQKLLELITKVLDPFLAQDLREATERLAQEARYSDKPRDVLDMD